MFVVMVDWQDKQPMTVYQPVIVINLATFLSTLNDSQKESSPLQQYYTWYITAVVVYHHDLLFTNSSAFSV